MAGLHLDNGESLIALDKPGCWAPVAVSSCQASCKQASKQHRSPPHHRTHRVTTQQSCFASCIPPTHQGNSRRSSSSASNTFAGHTRPSDCRRCSLSLLPKSSAHPFSQSLERIAAFAATTQCLPSRRQYCSNHHIKLPIQQRPLSFQLSSVCFYPSSRCK